MPGNDPNLEARVAKLEQWQKERQVQQIVYPLDAVSVNILKNYVMVIEKGLAYFGGVSGNRFEVFIGKQGAREFSVAGNTYYPFTVNATTDIVTAGFAFENDQLLIPLETENSTLPAPLVAGTDYYVVNSANNGTFQLSATLGGVAINFTDTGLGEHYFTFF